MFVGFMYLNTCAQNVAIAPPTWPMTVHYFVTAAAERRGELQLAYLHALVGIAQAQLPAGHHGLPGGPGLATDQTPALRSVGLRAQHLYAALITGPSARESDLRRAKEVRAQRAEARGSVSGSSNSSNMRQNSAFIWSKNRSNQWLIDN